MSKTNDNKSFDLTEKEIKTLINNADKDIEKREKVKDFVGYYIITDTDSGEYDSEKGAMTDYYINLFDDKDNHIAEAYGGYYTGQTGECFNTETFYYVKPKIKVVKRKLSEFDNYLIELANLNMSEKDKINNLEKFLFN